MDGLAWQVPPMTSTTTKAIDQAERHANPAWLADAAKAVLWCAHNYATFTSDDVWRRMSRQHHTHEPRALGAVFRNAARAGWIVRTTTTVPTKRPEAHHRPVAVWRSQLWKQVPP
jgi:hypothetical protein